MSAALAGLTRHSVLVTRPAGQAADLIERLRERGAEAVALPTISIQPAASSPALDAALGSVEVADWLVFVSRNAIEYGLALLAERGQYLSPHSRLATVGEGSARALRSRGYTVDCKPRAGYTSESLLAQPCFDVGADDRVLIFRGEGGRAFLAETLKERGARVRYAEVYRREMPQIDVKGALSQWRQGERRWVLATSVEGLHNLLKMASAAGSELRRAHLLTVSERIAAAAREAGWRGSVLIAREPGDDGIVAALETGSS